ncbi:Histone like [Actinidia chinensis var. chinensis]|uniref:Histone like n=1 Tax=Actinidia chinensis var. chinensis TaxID=1590841 RepID=A0A2R6QYT1_ACTCC|nr:Histone like [Actinidia chinensis var. chinensis]
MAGNFLKEQKGRLGLPSPEIMENTSYSRENWKHLARWRVQQRRKDSTWSWISSSLNLSSFGLPEPKKAKNASEDRLEDDVPTLSGEVGGQIGYFLSFPIKFYYQSWGKNSTYLRNVKEILKKISEKVTQFKSKSSAAGPTPTKKMVIGEKRSREDLTSSPNKKGTVDDSSKGKEASQAPEARKKAVRPGNLTFSKATPSSSPGDGTSTNLGTALGPSTSILYSPSVVKKLLRGVVPPADKEKVEKLTLDQKATKLFHVIGQQALVLRSSLAVQSKEAGEEASLQQGRATSLESKAIDELTKMKVDQDFLADKLERSGVFVVELMEKITQAQTSAMEEFKSLSNLLRAIEDVASKYFDEGFDFYKWQLRRHHHDLTIDLEGMGLDHDLLAEEEEDEEKRENEGENKEDGGKDNGDVKPPSLNSCNFFRGNSDL